MNLLVSYQDIGNQMKQMKLTECLANQNNEATKSYQKTLPERLQQSAIGVNHSAMPSHGWWIGFKQVMTLLGLTSHYPQTYRVTNKRTDGYTDRYCPSRSKPCRRRAVK
jgi:hypothetical protein